MTSREEVTKLVELMTTTSQLSADDVVKKLGSPCECSLAFSVCRNHALAC